MNPLDYFQQYEVQTTLGNFSIYTNQDLATFNACCINWEARHDLKSVKQARQSLINYINSKNWAGFYAFKNKKEYNKIINN